MKPTEPDYRKGEHTQILLMAQDISYIRETVKDLKVEVQAKYVTNDQFEPIKKIVYGLVSAVLLAVIAAAMALVVRSPQ
jgi:thiosulfate reductase cytochrome b subunit